jgi:glycosyltransferase involved in cell wall biosynthesis
MHKWHIITGEYPPQFGGVSDYTYLLAHGLRAAGDEVEVWAPRCREMLDHDHAQTKSAVLVHRLPGRFGLPALAELERGLRRHTDGERVLVQYVPQMYGFKAMNVGFCSWLRWRRDLRPWVMFHEVAMPRLAGQSWRHRVLANVTRRMAALVAHAAQRLFVSIPRWEGLLRDICTVREPVTWLPIPSTVPTQAEPEAVQCVRGGLKGAGPLIGHFGSFGTGLIAGLLHQILPIILAADREMLLLGRGSGEFTAEFGRRHPELASRIHARADLAPPDIAVHLAACDLLVQPYPDGVSSRRTSVMAGLALGQPIVTTTGAATEPVWTEQRLVAASAVDDAGGLAAHVDRLLADPSLRREYGERARAGYEQNFSLRRTIETLRGS